MFTGDLERKTYADVEAFLAEKLPEGTRLDYKCKMPGNIERPIAAMANSEGGVIMIGVGEEPATRKPKLPPVGIELAGQAERVQSKAYQAIHEPITALDIGTFPFPDDGERGILVVRVHPSERAPHAVDQGLRILRRVGAQAMPEGKDLDDRMHLDRIGWLFERRQRNQHLIDAAMTRYESLLLWEPPPAGHYRFDIAAWPVVAHADPLTVKDLKNLVHIHSGYSDFPVNWRAIAGGLVNIQQPEYWSHYCDVTGLTACTATWEIKEKRTPREIYGTWWFGTSLALLKWVGMASRKSGRGGTIRVRARLERVLGARLVLNARSGFDQKPSLQDELSATAIASVDDLASDPKPCAAELFSQLAEAFDWVIPVETMLKRLP